MRALDARAIRELAIPGARLMDNAGTAAATRIARWLAPIRAKRVVVVCGKGNNGGDGFVVARRLHARGAAVRVFLVGRRDEVLGDAAHALRQWRGAVAEITTGAGLDALARELERARVIVDALLGTGLTGPARGLAAGAIEAINRITAAGDEPRRSGAPVVALDLPSGLDSDRGVVIGPTVRATWTVTFAGLKRCLPLYPAAAAGLAQGPLRPPADRGGLARQDRRGRARRPGRAAQRCRALHDRGAAKIGRAHV